MEEKKTLLGEGYSHNSDKKRATRKQAAKKVIDRAVGFVVESLERRQLLSPPYGFNNVGIGGTGTDYYANVNPKNPDDIYLETDMGEVWHTTNDGQTWQSINEMSQIASYQGEVYVQFTSNQNTQYALSGGNSRPFPWQPTVTTNDGATWSVLPGWASISSNGPASNVLADPNNTSDIIVTQDKGVGGDWNYWFWFSSDGGNHFQLIASNTTGTNPYEDWVAGTFWDPNGKNAYLATDVGLFTTGDMQDSTPVWTPSSATFSTTNEAYFSFTGSDQGGTTQLWAVTDQLSNFTGRPSIVDAADSVNLYSSTSTNGAVSWTNMTSSGPTVGGVQQPWNDTATNTANLRIEWVQMAENNTNDIWIGGEDYTYTGEYQGPTVYESTNAGSNWIRLLQTGADSKYMTDSTGGVTSVSVTSGGSGYTADPTVTITGGGATVNATATAVETSGVVTSVIITSVGSGYTSTNVTVSFSGGGATTGAAAKPIVSVVGSAEMPDQNLYAHAYGLGGGPQGLIDWGLGSTVTFLVNRTNPSIITFTVQDTVFESIDGGANWFDIDAGGPSLVPQSQWDTFWNPEGTRVPISTQVPSSSMEETATWNQTFVTPTTIFSDITDNTFEQSTNDGATWNFPSFSVAMSPPNTFYQSAYQASTGILYAVTSNKHNLYSSDFTDDGEVEQFGDNYFVQSVDGGETWQVDYSFPVSDAARTLTLDPNNPDVAFVGTANHVDGVGGIWMTTDLQSGAGATWTYLGQNSGGSGATGTAIMNGTSIAGVTITNGGSGYSSNTAFVYFTGGGLGSSANQALASVTVSAGGAITGVTMISGGAGPGYTSAPTVVFGVGQQPQRSGAFSAMHPVELYLLNNDTVNGVASPANITLVAVMAERTDNSGTALDDAGVWTGTTTNGGVSWIWTDDSDPSAATLPYNGTNVPNNIPYLTSSLTIDPNDPSQNTWFVTTENGDTNASGYIYKTTNAGATWTVWSSVGQGESLWIQPGGTMALFAAKNYGVDLIPNYTLANPQFYQEQNFPFPNVTTILSNPYNSNQIWFDAFGTGMWETDLTQLGIPATPLDVTAQTMSSSEVMVGWTTQAPLPSSFVIQASTDGVNFTNPISQTVNNWQDSSSLFTGLNSNTRYYFRVEAVNSTGASVWSNSPTFQDSSVGSARTDAPAGLIASETFNYTTGSSLNGQSGGTGWAGGSSWSAASSDKIVAPLTGFPGTPPTDNGNAVYINSNATRTLSTSVGQSATVLWAGFEENLQSAHSGLLLGNTTNGFVVGAPNNPQGNGKDNPAFEIISGGISTYINANGTVPFSPASSHFFVAEMDFESSGTYVNLYLDPAAGLTEPPVNSSAEMTWSTPPASLGVSLLNNGKTLFIPITSWQPAPANTVMLMNTGDFSAVRLGNTYADVAPLTQSAPSAPTGLTAEPVAFNANSTNATSFSVNSSSEIDLTWTNNAAANQTGVIIQQSGGGSGWTTIEKIIDPTSAISSYSVTDLTANTPYVFQIQSYNTAGSSAWDVSAITATNSTAPAAVTNLAVATANGQFNLAWSATPGSTGYVVQYATGDTQAFNDGELNWQSVNISSASATSAIISAATPNSLYYFRIYPYSSGGEASCSNIVSATSYAAPINVTAVGVGSGQVALTWSDSITTMTGFNIQYSTDDVNWTSAGSTPEGNNAFTVTGLNADTQYYFQVQAYATGSTGAWSSPAVARTLNAAAAAEVYEGFDYPAGENAGGQSGGVGWAPGSAWVPPASGAYVASITSPSLIDSNSEVADTLLTTGNSYYAKNSSSLTRTLASTIPNTAGTTTWLSVLVSDQSTTANGYVELIGNGSGDNIQFGFPTSGDFSINVMGHGGYEKASPVQGDTYLLVLEITYGSSTSQVQMWVDPDPLQPSGPAAYSTYINSGTLSLVPNNINSVEIVGATSGQTQVNTWDELRIGSTYASVVPEIVPTAPTNLTAAGASSDIALDWTASGSSSNLINGYDIWRSTDGVNFGSAPYASVPSGMTTYTDSSTASGTTYYYEVTAYNPTGDSLNSNVASASYTTTPAAVVGEYIFYGGSSFDGNAAAPNAKDNSAIATDKTALLPGQKASFANYTSYSRGINGIMLDLADAPPMALSLSDFTFEVGNSSNLSTWTAAPTPTNFVPTAGGGVDGSQRVEFVWANNAIENQWLQVTVLADSDTGLTNPFVFYFGNAIGSTGASATSARVTTADVTRTQAAVAPGLVPITSDFDFNRDGRVNSADVTICQANVSPSALQLITPPAGSPSLVEANSLAAASPAAASNTAPTAAPVDAPTAANLDAFYAGMDVAGQPLTGGADNADDVLLGTANKNGVFN